MEKEAVAAVVVDEMEWGALEKETVVATADRGKVRVEQVMEKEMVEAGPVTAVVPEVEEAMGVAEV